MIRSDEPIENSEEDVLDRTRVATSIASEIRAIDASRGAVVGILGPWGSGKTSLVNLIRNELTGPPWIRSISFNPWMFSGSDQLVERFFSELAAQLREQPGKFTELADALADYGEAMFPLHVIPVAGPWLGLLSGAAKGLKALRAKGKGGIQQQRDQLSEKLRKLDSPLLVVLDDIDRLRTDEIRDIFKLVRLTAHFPNIIYLVAFDRARVERALEEDGVPGRDYLEKIIQVVYDIPVIPDQALREQITGAIDETLAAVANPGRFDHERWPDVFFEVVRPLIRNMRDVRRYAGSLRGTLQSLDGKVALVDVLGLEAIRVFLPDVFALITQNPDALTTPRSQSAFDQQAETQRKASIEALIEAADPKQAVATAMIARLFPAALHHLENVDFGHESMREWIREARVAHPHMLRFYLERVAGGELQAFWAAAAAVQVMDDGERLDAYLRSLEPSTLEGVIDAMAVYVDDFPVEAALPSTVVLLNLLWDIPERPRRMSDVGPDVVVSRVVLRALGRLPDAESIVQVVRAALPQISTLSAKLELVQLVGYDEHAGHRLISQDASRELEASLRAEIQSVDAGALAAEPALLRLLFWTKRATPAGEPSVDDRFMEPVLSCAMLKSAVAHVRSQTFGTRTGRVKRDLDWQTLVELVGDESAAVQIIEACRGRTDDPALVEALALADQYLGGSPR